MTPRERIGALAIHAGPRSTRPRIPRMDFNLKK
jgi:hypothetical protein